MVMRNSNTVQNARYHQRENTADFLTVQTKMIIAAVLRKICNVVLDVCYNVSAR